MSLQTARELPRRKDSLRAPVRPTGGSLEPFPGAPGSEPFPGAERFPGSDPFPDAGRNLSSSSTGTSGHVEFKQNAKKDARKPAKRRTATEAEATKGKSSRCQAIQPYVIASFSLYGGQLFWLGAWEAVDVDMVVAAGFAESHLRDFLLTATGVLGLVFLDRWYEEGGLPGSIWYDEQGLLCGRWRLPTIRSTSPLGKLQYVITTLLTLFCSTLFWVGIFNLVDDYVPASILNSTYSYICFVILGFAMMLVTGTLFESSGVESTRDELSWSSPCMEHAKEIVRTLFAISAQVLLWYGVCSLYWVICLDGSGCADTSANWWKNLFLMAVGHMLLNATESFITTPENDEEDPAKATEPATEHSEKLKQAELISRSILAILAGAVHNIGLWETYDTLLFPGWVDCSHEPKEYPGTSGAGVPAGQPVIGSGYPPCWVRNIIFMVVGILMQPNVLVLPLLEPDKKGLPPAPIGMLHYNDDDLTPKSRARSRSESIARAQGMNDDLGAARRQRYGSTKMTLISTIPAPSRRKATTASFELERRRREKFMQRNNVLAAPKARTQSEQGTSPGASLRRRAAKQGRGLVRNSLKDKLMTTSSNDSDRSPSHSRGDGYSPLGFRDSFGSDSADSGDGLGLGSLSIPIPESKMEEGSEDGDVDSSAVATSLPTPRTLRLLSDERFLRDHFPEKLAARSFAVGERVEADWNSFGNWYSGVIASVNPVNHNQYTIKYDDDSVEKDVPAVLIRPARSAISEMGTGLQLGAGTASATVEAPAYETWTAYSGLDELVNAESGGGDAGSTENSSERPHEPWRPIRSAELSFDMPARVVAPKRQRGSSEAVARDRGESLAGQVNRGRAASAELAKTSSLPTVRE